MISNAIFSKLFVVSLITFSNSLEIGDKCTVLGRSGVCSLDVYCASFKTFSSNERRIVFSEKCGFEGIRTIICCPKIQESASTLTPKLSTTPSTTRLTTHLTTPSITSQMTTQVISTSSQSKITGNDRRSKIACDELNKFDPLLRLSGAEDALVGDFPQFAALGYQDILQAEPEFLCAGALISKKFVLTSAHCVSFAEPVHIVRLGTVALKAGINQAAYMNRTDIEAKVGFSELFYFSITNI